MSTQIVREYTGASQLFVDRPKTAVAPAPVVTATNADCRSAFDDLMRALAPAERTAITRDLRGRATGRPKAGRQLDTSPAAVAEARRLFGF